MADYSMIPATTVERSGLCRARFVGLSSDGRALVCVSTADRTVRECDFLVSLGDAVRPTTDDEVFVWLPPDDDTPGVIVGVIASHPANTRTDDAPDTLVIEAKESLTLRVGDGSITIRADGKILIKGKELVSHAKNVNRVKGGAVAIN